MSSITPLSLGRHTGIITVSSMHLEQELPYRLSLSIIVGLASGLQVVRQTDVMLVDTATRLQPLPVPCFYLLVVILLASEKRFRVWPVLTSLGNPLPCTLRQPPPLDLKPLASFSSPCWPVLRLDLLFAYVPCPVPLVGGAMRYNPSSFFPLGIIRCSRENVPDPNY